MSLAKKLNFKPGQTAEVFVRPEGVSLGDVEVVASGATGGVIVFARSKADVDAQLEPVLAALRAGQIPWIMYPKAGQLGTDLNRDILNRHLRSVHGLGANRQISVDDTWSALRFKHATGDD